MWHYVMLTCDIICYLWHYYLCHLLLIQFHLIYSSHTLSLFFIKVIFRSPSRLNLLHSLSLPPSFPFCSCPLDLTTDYSEYNRDHNFLRMTRVLKCLYILGLFLSLSSLTYMHYFYSLPSVSLVLTHVSSLYIYWYIYAHSEGLEKWARGLQVDHFSIICSFSLLCRILIYLQNA